MFKSKIFNEQDLILLKVRKVLILQVHNNAKTLYILNVYIL